VSDPVIRWTIEEGWLMAALARRALVARLDGGAPIREDGARFRVDIQTSDTAVELALSAGQAARVELALAPESVAGHRWRDGWVIALDGGAILEPGGAFVAVALPARAQLRIRRRAIVRDIDTVPLLDVAFHRYTRQSSAIELPVAPIAPWAAPTARELAPWWEIDLGRPQYIAWLRIDLALARPPPGARVRCYACGFMTPAGAPLPGSCIVDMPAQDRIELEPACIARYVRIELVAAEPVELAVTGAEIHAASLYAETLAGTLRRAFALFADRPLCVEPACTYAEVWARAMALARGLAARCETPGARTVLGVMLRNRLEWIVVELAALARGYVVVALSPDDDGERLARILELAQPRLVISEAALAGVEHVTVDQLAALTSDVEPPPAAAVGEGDPYAILFTSGSTGTPKGAVRSYRTFLAMIESYAIAHSPRHLSFQPVSHLSERMYLPALLVHGGTIGFARGGASLLDELRAFGPTTIGTVPRVYELLYATYQRRARSEGEDRALAEARAAFGPNLLAISVGSAPSSPDVLAFMRRCFSDIWVSEGYGSTEVGSITSDGRVLEHVEVKLVPGPDRGEIWVRTPHVISGYLGDPEATRAALDADGFFTTGDLGERDADGRVRVIGRLRNTVKLAQGEFVSAERIEGVLASAPAVDRIYVHVAHGAPGIAAAVVPRGGERHDTAAAILADLRAYGSAHGLEPYELPRGVLLVGELPTTATNKLARATIAERHGGALAALAAGPVLEPSGGGTLLERIVAVASRVAGHAIAADEPLGTGIGLDSLAAAEAIEALSIELGRDIPLAWWFEARDLAALAHRLAGHHTDAANRELALADLDLAVPRLPPPPAPPRSVLLTGATGFLGRHLARALAARDIAVTCLVRDPARAPAGARVVVGDLTALPALPDVDAIVHCGAVVSWLASYPALRGPNVLGTHALLQRGIPMHFISTISTAAGDESTALALDAALAGTPYVLSKWVAEALARRAGATIYRPSMIAPDSRTGVGNPDDFVMRYLQGCRDLGLYIDRDDAVQDLTPVDFVAEAIAALVAAGNTDTIHLANVEQSPSFAALGRAQGPSVRPASYAEFRAALLANKTSRLHALAAFFPETFSLGMGPFPRALSLTRLAALGIAAPLIDAATIARYR
jgi:fatty acid CoA ligase FadD9